jgi:hypothetical protein
MIQIKDGRVTGMLISKDINITAPNNHMYRSARSEFLIVPLLSFAPDVEG